MTDRLKSIATTAAAACAGLAFMAYLIARIYAADYEFALLVGMAVN